MDIQQFQMAMNSFASQANFRTAMLDRAIEVVKVEADFMDFDTPTDLAKRVVEVAQKLELHVVEGDIFEHIHNELEDDYEEVDAPEVTDRSDNVVSVDFGNRGDHETGSED